MRHNFVNDIGDYGKYALLRALVTSDALPMRLGVIWYLTEHPERNGDGRRRAHLSGDGWDELDPGLLAEMREIEGSLHDKNELHLSLIERSAILPTETVYFSEAIPDAGIAARLRIQARAAWFERAKQAVVDCNLLFLDPDNGLEVRSVAPGSRSAAKYVMATEIEELITTGVGVVLYQHGDRSLWPVQRERIRQQLVSSVAPQPLVLRTVRFGAFGARAFFCVTTNPEIAAAFDAGLLALSERAAKWEKAHYMLFE